MSYRRDWIGIKINPRIKLKCKHNLPEPLENKMAVLRGKLTALKVLTKIIREI